MSDSSLPQPLTTPDMDVRDLDGFMLNTDRLLASELWALATGEEFKAAVGLWCRAWKQIPAGSLPNDDRILASFAAVTPQRWSKVRAVALRGFVSCSDGRLYHRVLCEDVRRAFEKKLTKRGNREGDAERKRREREDRSMLFETLREAGKAPPWNTPTSDLRILAMGVTAHAVPPVTNQNGDGVTPPVTRTVTVITGRDGDDDDDGTNLETPPSPGTTSARGPAATAARARVIGVSPEAVGEAVDRGDVQGVLRAFGCDLTGDREGEWLRDADGLQIGKLVVIMGWRRSSGAPVRQPSGLRAARAAWRNLEADARAEWARALAKAYGLPAIAEPAVPADGVAP